MFYTCLSVHRGASIPQCNGAEGVHPSYNAMGHRGCIHRTMQWGRGVHSSHNAMGQGVHPSLGVHQDGQKADGTHLNEYLLIGSQFIFFWRTRKNKFMFSFRTILKFLFQKGCQGLASVTRSLLKHLRPIFLPAATLSLWAMSFDISSLTQSFWELIQPSEFKTSHRFEKWREHNRGKAIS